MITCRGLTKRFGDHTAVSGLNLEIPSGDICCFLGPNGAGKSTTVKMLTGLLEPTEGSAEVCGLNVAAKPIEVRRITGTVPEHLGLFDSLTVAEHLRLTGDVWGLDRRDRDRRAADLLSALALEHGADTFAAECSHGMRKKLSLAAALLPNPKLLFLDEPFEGVDAVASLTIRDLLSNFVAKGSTVFLTSHVLEIVERLCTHVGIIQNGKLIHQCQIGSFN